MGRLSKASLLGASDLTQKEVDLPTLGGSVLVTSLPAAYSNQAITEALETAVDERGRQIAKVNTVRLEELQVLHGLVEPKLDTLEEVRGFAEKCGPSWKLIVQAIDDVSNVNQEATEKAKATFPSGGANGDGGARVGDAAAGGDGEPDLPGPAGNPVAHESGADE